MNIDQLENQLREECPTPGRSCIGDGTQVLVMLDGNVFEIDHVELDTDGTVYVMLQE